MSIGHFQSTIILTKGFPIGEAFLSNQTSSHISTGVLLNAGIAFSSDGGVYDVGPLQADRTLFVSGEWHANQPIDNIGQFYDVREESLFSGTTWDFQPGTLGDWFNLASERVWRNNVTVMDPAVVSSTSNFEIRLKDDGTNVLDSAFYTGTVDNT